MKKAPVSNDSTWVPFLLYVTLLKEKVVAAQQLFLNNVCSEYKYLTYVKNEG